jgi:DNA end-binding protein Ku
MKPRSTWTGFLKLSLVTVPVRVYTASEAGAKIAFHQLHKQCHQRMRQKLVCPVHGEVEREDITKGYECSPDQYVVVDESDLEQVRLETTHTIDLVQFIRPEELDAIYLDAPYYVGPDGPVAEEAYGVVREALQRTNLVGIGRVVLAGKEKLIALRPLEKGLVFFTLRYAAAVRPAAAYFEAIQARTPDEAQVALAQKLIASKRGTWSVSQFTDRYQAALLDLIKTKIEWNQPVLVPRREEGQVVNLLEALRQSVAQLGDKATVPIITRKAARRDHNGTILDSAILVTERAKNHGNGRTLKRRV